MLNFYIDLSLYYNIIITFFQEKQRKDIFYPPTQARQRKGVASR